MPYERVSDIPGSVRRNLPGHAANIWRAAYNSCVSQHGDNPKKCAKIAWGAVKNAGYAKGDDGEWSKGD